MRTDCLAIGGNHKILQYFVNNLRYFRFNLFQHLVQGLDLNDHNERCIDPPPSDFAYSSNAETEVNILRVEFGYFRIEMPGLIRKICPSHSQNDPVSFAKFL